MTSYDLMNINEFGAMNSVLFLIYEHLVHPFSFKYRSRISNSFFTVLTKVGSVTTSNINVNA